MNLGLGNILQTIPDDTFQQLFASACLTDENGDIILQEDGVSCISLENESGAATAPDIEGLPIILGGMTIGDVLTATSATIIGNPTPTVSWQWQESATKLGTVNELSSPSDFSNTTDWVQANTTRTGGQTGYDGSNNAWELTRSLGGSLIVNQTVSTTGLHTFEIYVKVNPSNSIALTFGSPSVNAYFNISDASHTSAVSSSGLISSSQEYVGNDFYKLSITTDAASTGVNMYALVPDASTADTTGATFIVQDPSLVTGQPASFSDISGATSFTYTIQSSDLDKYLRVVQTATNTEGSDVERSLSTSIVTSGVTQEQIIINAFVSRVEADGGTVGNTNCLETDLTFLTQN